MPPDGKGPSSLSVRSPVKKFQPRQQGGPVVTWRCRCPARAIAFGFCRFRQSVRGLPWHRGVSAGSRRPGRGLLQLSAHRRDSPAIGQPRRPPHHRQVLGTVVLPVAKAVLPHGHVQASVPRVFHRPVHAHGLQEPLRTRRFAEQEEAGLRAPFPLVFRVALQAGPVMQVLQRVDVVADGREPAAGIRGREP